MTQTRKAQLASLSRACAREARRELCSDVQRLIKCVRVTRKIICWAAYLIMSIYVMITFINMMRAKRGMIMKSKIVWQQAKIMRAGCARAARR